MKERDIEGVLSPEEIKQKKITGQIHDRIKEIREECIAVFEDPQNREDAALKQGNTVYLRDSRERVHEYLEKISEGLTPRLIQDSEFNTLRSETLLHAADITICTFVFRDAYKILTEAIPLLEGNVLSQMHAHLTSAHCAAYSPHWQIPLLRQASKIRTHIKETLLLSQGATTNEIYTAIMSPLWIAPFKVQDIEFAHISAQKEMNHEFVIPDLIHEVLTKGRV